LRLFAFDSFGNQLGNKPAFLNCRLRESGHLSPAAFQAEEIALIGDYVGCVSDRKYVRESWDRKICIYLYSATSSGLNIQPTSCRRSDYAR
jgi:hypothetical protein